jgi:nucleoid-associated protein YgaU
MNNEDSSQGKLNWKLALIISAVIHVVCLGLILLSADSPACDENAETEEKSVPKSADEGKGGDSSASGTSETPDSSARVDRGGSGTSTSRPPDRRTSRPRPNDGSDRGGSGAQSGEYVDYTVQRGDNLSKIAKKHKCTENEIIKLNKIKNPNKIGVGLKLKIPAPAR